MPGGTGPSTEDGSGTLGLGSASACFETTRLRKKNGNGEKGQEVKRGGLEDTARHTRPAPMFIFTDFLFFPMLFCFLFFPLLLHFSLNFCTFALCPFQGTGIVARAVQFRTSFETLFADRPLLPCTRL